MTDDTTTVYLSEGALAQKRCYHTDPDGCQSITTDEDVEAVTKEVAEDELGLKICTWCSGGIDQSEHDQTEHDQTLNQILSNADPDDGWEGVREQLAEAEQETAQ